MLYLYRASAATSVTEQTIHPPPPPQPPSLLKKRRRKALMSSFIFFLMSYLNTLKTGLHNYTAVTNMPSMNQSVKATARQSVIKLFIGAIIAHHSCMPCPVHLGWFGRCGFQCHCGQCCQSSTIYWSVVSSHLHHQASWLAVLTAHSVYLQFKPSQWFVTKWNIIIVMSLSHSQVFSAN